MNKTHGERTEVSFFKDAEIDAEKCFDIVFIYRENRFEICSGGRYTVRQMVFVMF